MLSDASAYAIALIAIGAVGACSREDDRGGLLALVVARKVVGLRWTATTIAGVYLAVAEGMVLAMKAGLDEFPEHPITRGVEPFEINDEWYYHMRFVDGMDGVTPILTDLPPRETLSFADYMMEEAKKGLLDWVEKKLPVEYGRPPRREDRQG